MLWVRSWLFNILFYLVVAFYSLLILLGSPFLSTATLREIGRSWSRVCRWLLKMTCGLTVRVEGMDKLPEAPFVIMSKHQSAWETVMLPGFFPAFVWILKRDLFYIPLFGWALRLLGQIGIRRGSPMEAVKQVQRDGAAALKTGTNIAVFPEGSRVAAGEVGHYNPGGVLVALASGVPIVPVAHNAGVFWARRSALKYQGEVQLRVGQPILTKGLPKSARKELIVKVQEQIEGMMQEM